jgi:hypothetical protein
VMLRWLNGMKLSRDRKLSETRDEAVLSVNWSLNRCGFDHPYPRCIFSTVLLTRS